MSHLSPEILIDVAEGTRPESGVPHLRTCAFCREQVAELRQTLATIAVEVPEPSPLFWDHLSARVREATAAEAARSRSRWSVQRLPWRLATAVGAAVIVIAVSFTMKTTPERATVPFDTVAPVGGAGIEAVADDPSLSLLADLAGDLDWDAAAEAGMTMVVGAADGALMELSGAERVELQRLLREAMSSSGA